MVKPLAAEVAVVYQEIGYVTPRDYTKKRGLRIDLLASYQVPQPHIKLGSHSPGNFVCAGVLAMWMSLPVSVNACSPLIVA